MDQWNPGTFGFPGEDLGYQDAVPLAPIVEPAFDEAG